MRERQSERFQDVLRGHVVWDHRFHDLELWEIEVPVQSPFDRIHGRSEELASMEPLDRVEMKLKMMRMKMMMRRMKMVVSDETALRSRSKSVVEGSELRLLVVRGNQRARTDSTLRQSSQTGIKRQRNRVRSRRERDVVSRLKEWESHVEESGSSEPKVSLALETMIWMIRDQKGRHTLLVA